MKIIAPAKIKARLILFIVLFSILTVLSVSSTVVNKLSTVDVYSGNASFKTVIVDAGHGGIDGGTSADDGTIEKEINLQIALKLNEILNSMGVKTIMTRTDDASIHDSSAQTIRQQKVSDIKNRLKIINETDDAVFVSIHQNHYSKSQYSGTQIFYSKNDPDSQVLADSIRLSVISYLQPENSREIKQSGTDIYLLYHAQKPSVMVECGFLSNYEETQKLKDEKYQRELAFSVALGIIDYFKKTEEI